MSAYAVNSSPIHRRSGDLIPWQCLRPNGVREVGPVGVNHVGLRSQFNKLKPAFYPITI